MGTPFPNLPTEMYLMGKRGTGDRPTPKDFYESPYYWPPPEKRPRGEPGAEGVSVTPEESTRPMVSAEIMRQIMSVPFAMDAPNIREKTHLTTNWFTTYVRLVSAFKKTDNVDNTAFGLFLTNTMVFLYKDRAHPLRVGDENAFGAGGDPMEIARSYGVVDVTDDMWVTLKPLGQRYAEFTLQGLNYTMRIGEQASNDPYAAPPREAWTQWRDWAFDGVAAFQEGGPVDITAHPAPMTDPSAEQIITMKIQGLAWIHNYWGNDIEPLTRLWLILRRVGPNNPKPYDQVPTDYVLSEDGEKKRFVQSSIVIRGVTRQLVSNPWQLIPWASASLDQPPLSMLTSWDDFGREVRCLPIHVGFVEDKPKPCNLDVASMVWYNTAALRRMPEMIIYVDKKPSFV